jgi:hypothetical protein
MAGKVHNTLRSGRIPILWAAGAVTIVALVPVVIGALAAGGFFDALLDRFTSDGGSANARIEMFAMFDNLSFRDLLVGPDTGLVEYLRRVNGLEWGIENPIINDILYQGLMITGLMIVAVSLFLTEIALLCGRGVWVQMAAFAILINTSESIASKTTMLSQFVVLVLCLYRPLSARIVLASRPGLAPILRSRGPASA